MYVMTRQAFFASRLACAGHPALGSLDGFAADGKLDEMKRMVSKLAVATAFEASFSRRRRGSLTPGRKLTGAAGGTRGLRPAGGFLAAPSAAGDALDVGAVKAMPRSPPMPVP